MKYKKVNNLVNMEVAKGNHVLVTIDFRRKLPVNMFVFKAEDAFEVPDKMKESLENDPILRSEGIGKQEVSLTPDNVFDINTNTKAS